MFKHIDMAAWLHGAYAAVVTFLFSLLGHAYLGAYTMSVFYYSRELAQHQEELSEITGLPRIKLGLKGLLVFDWNVKQIMQFAVPTIIGFIAASIIQLLF